MMYQFIFLNHTDMKTSFFLTTFCLITLSAFILYGKLAADGDNTSIAISENDDAYQFKASYKANDSRRVLEYINRNMQASGQRKPEDNYFDLNTRRIDVSTTLADKTEFYIKESPGRLNIVLDKHKNSYNSYERIKHMCEGIKNILAGK
jgi:hypothetical protein